MLGVLGDYGGSTVLYPLQKGSPAIDAGPLGTCLAPTDQRRILRPRDGNGDGLYACDLGAFEYGEHFFVTAAATDGLVGHWRFDEGSGSVAADASGNGLTGLLQGSAGFTTAAAPVLFADSGALAGGPDGNVQVSDAALLNPSSELSLSAWVRLNSTAGEQPIIAKVASPVAGPGYRMGVRDGTLFADIWDNTGTRTA